MKKAFANLKGDLAGTYFPLTGMGEKVRQQLVDDHFLFVSGDPNLKVAARSPVRLAKAFFIRFSTPSLCSLVIPGERPNPSILRPTRILVECTGAAGSIFPWILDTSMSLSCTASAEMPWYSWMMGSNTSANTL